MDKKDKLYIALYNDYYGALLTEYQSNLVSQYYDMDMSLAEIAEEHGISPQGVRDALVRAQKTLEGYERKLGTAKKTSLLIDIVSQAKACKDEEERQKLLDRALEILTK